MADEINYKTWRLNKEAAASAVIQQDEYNPITNGFGCNDFVMEFLKDEKLWDTLINSRSKLLKKENGKDPIILNEIMAIKELVGIRRISNSRPLFKDVNLMAELGFNLEEVISRSESGQGVISANTLRNHSDRIPVEESYRGFYEHVDFLRSKKWLRGGIYAVDGYEIEITVDNDKTQYENAGSVWSDEENRWKYGYKLLLLVNIAKDRERIVGAYLDRIEVNEGVIFNKMLAHIEQYLCPFEDIVKILIADRAYWNEKLIRMLKKEKGIDIVMLAKSNLGFVKKDLKDLIRQDRIEFMPYKLENPKYYCRKTDIKLRKPSKQQKYIEVELAVERDMDFAAFKDGYLNVVIRRECDKNGQYQYMFYVTTKQFRDPVSIVNLYRLRTTIENDVNRELDQRWFMRSLAGRKRNIMLARIMMVIKLFNCEKILEMKHPKYYEEVKKRMKEKEKHSFLKEVDIAVYINKKNIFGIFKASEFARLIKERTKYAVKKKLSESDKQLTMEEVMDLIDKL